MPDTPGASLPDAPPSGHWVDRIAPASLRPFLKLARIDRPIGWWLLLLPCWWSTGLAAMALGPWTRHVWPVLLWHALLFLIGAIVMRGAGAAFNDIVDRDLDRQVSRTRNRPMPSGAVSVRHAAFLVMGLALLGLGVLLQFNWFTVLLGMSSLVIVAIYPFMKRITHMPQLVLGLAFSWGALVGWSAVTGFLAWPAVLACLAAVLWTIAYDTIYAMQDIEDDEIVGIKSSARLFKGHTQMAVALMYGAAVLAILAAAMAASAGWIGLPRSVPAGQHLAADHDRAIRHARGLAPFEEARTAAIHDAMGAANADGSEGHAAKLRKRGLQQSVCCLDHHGKAGGSRCRAPDGHGLISVHNGNGDVAAIACDQRQLHQVRLEQIPGHSPVGQAQADTAPLAATYDPDSGDALHRLGLQLCGQWTPVVRGHQRQGCLRIFRHLNACACRGRSRESMRWHTLPSGRLVPGHGSTPLLVPAWRSPLCGPGFSLLHGQNGIEMCRGA